MIKSWHKTYTPWIINEALETIDECYVKYKKFPLKKGKKKKMGEIEKFLNK